MSVAPTALVKGVAMAKKQPASGGRGGDGYYGGGDNGGNDSDTPREHYDDPDEHLEIERRRFAGGLTPTPERYALAREQWYRLPGALTRPSMDPPPVDTPPGDGPTKNG